MSQERPALALIDFDVKGMPAAVNNWIEAAGGLGGALEIVLPELANAAAARDLDALLQPADSVPDTGESVSGSSGVHVYVLVRRWRRSIELIPSGCCMTGCWLRAALAGC